VRVDELPPSRFASVLDVLEPSHTFTLGELCGLALATSDNRIATHLLSVVDPADVDTVLHAAGCGASRFGAGFSDKELGPAGRANVTTADDMLRLLRVLRDDPTLADVRRAMERCPLNARIPLRLPDDGRIAVANKTGSLAGVCNDIAIVEEADLVLAVAVLCDGQGDIARTSIDIGDCVRALWAAHGGRLPP
jgi:beta-lactamase class A